MPNKSEKPHPKAVESPTENGKWWFQGVSLNGLTTTPVQNRPVVADASGRYFDANTGEAIVSELRGWWVKEGDMA